MAENTAATNPNNPGARPQPTPGPVADDLDLKPARATAMFRAEMFATNFLLGYWKHIVAVVVIALVSVLVWGQYTDFHRRAQRDASRQIAEKLGELPNEIPYLAESIAQGEEVDRTKLAEVADGLVAIANGTAGTARVEAELHAAELYRMANDPEKQRNALTAASADGGGALGFAAESGLANLELAQDQGDAAVTRLRALADDNEGFLREQALLDLGLALEHLGKNDEAAKVYADFITEFPDSPRKALAQTRNNRVTGAPAAPAPAPAPEPAPPAPADGEGGEPAPEPTP